MRAQTTRNVNGLASGLALRHLSPHKRLPSSLDLFASIRHAGQLRQILVVI